MRATQYARQKVDFEEGLRKTVAWFNAHNVRGETPSSYRVRDGVHTVKRGIS